MLFDHSFKRRMFSQDTCYFLEQRPVDGLINRVNETNREE